MEFDELDVTFMNSMHRMRRINCFDMIPDMTKSEAIMLKVLCACGQDEIMVSDLQALVMMHPTAVSRLLNSLEEKGFVERTSRKGNRRVTDVHVTALGKQIENRNMKILHSYWKDVFHTISNEDMEHMLRIWTNVMDSMERVLSEKLKDRKEIKQ